jgi:MinD-like ATPase involved in chromosome partitioning or flagellar assembly
MALICVASAKGSPGATTTALTLTATWGRSVVLADADFAGSDLMYRLEADPDFRAGDGILACLSAWDRDGAVDIFEHTLRVVSGQDVLMGAIPSRAGELTGRWSDVARMLSHEDDVDVIADCGRLQPEFPGWPLLAVADALVLVTRPLIDGVAHALARAAEAVDVLEPGAECCLAVVTDPRDTRSLHEIETLVDRAGLPVHMLGRLADDPDGVALLSGRWSGRLERTILIRSARGLARRLQTRLLTPRPAATSVM